MSAVTVLISVVGAVEYNFGISSDQARDTSYYLIYFSS